MLETVVVTGCLRGALAVLMMDALPPNTMQTLEGTPALVHETWLKDLKGVRLNEEQLCIVLY